METKRVDAALLESNVADAFTCGRVGGQAWSTLIDVIKCWALFDAASWKVALSEHKGN
jgi:hypothetical protein